MPSSIINSDDGLVSGTSGIKTTGGDDGVLVFQSKGTETARINTDKQIVAAAGTASLPIYSTTGDVNTGIYFPAADNIGFATGGTIRGRWTTDGLCFGTDTAAANALDDYEEGTFTPTITGNSTAGTATYTQQVGQYTKIGNRVFINIFLQWSGGTGSGNMNIDGLPFTSESSTLNQSLSNYNGAVAMTAGHVMQLITGTNTTQVNVNSVPSGGGADANVPYDAAGLIIVGGSYRAA